MVYRVFTRSLGAAKVTRNISPPLLGFTSRKLVRCSSRELECRKSLSSDKYGEYIRVSHPYSLVITPQEFAAVNSQLAKINSELQRALEANHKTLIRLYKIRDRRRRLKGQR
jgi:hypothetical protein